MGNTVRDQIPCLNCGSLENKFEELIFKNGTKHIRRSCADCGHKINFVDQERPVTSENKFYSGKHKDKTFGEVYAEAPDYLNWCVENHPNEKLRKKIEVFLADKKGTIQTRHIHKDYEGISKAQ